MSCKEVGLFGCTSGIHMEKDFVSTWWKPVPEVLERGALSSYIGIEESTTKLVYVRFSQWNLVGEKIEGEVICAKSCMLKLIQVFKELFLAEVPLIPFTIHDARAQEMIFLCQELPKNEFKLQVKTSLFT